MSDSTGKKRKLNDQILKKTANVRAFCDEYRADFPAICKMRLFNDGRKWIVGYHNPRTNTCFSWDFLLQLRAECERENLVVVERDHPLPKSSAVEETAE